jgi:hypothetical protein
MIRLSFAVSKIQAGRTFRVLFASTVTPGTQGNFPGDRGQASPGLADSNPILPFGQRANTAPGDCVTHCLGGILSQ